MADLDNSSSIKNGSSCSLIGFVAPWQDHGGNLYRI